MLFIIFFLLYMNLKNVNDFFKQHGNSTDIENDYWMEFIIPNIIASVLIIFFDILFIILLVIVWKKK